MKHDGYKKNDPKKMALRDHLAYDRTILANERTLFAYLRFGIMAMVTGLTFVKVFADDVLFLYFGWWAFGLAIVAVVVGSIKFLVFRKKMRQVYRPLSK
jgi:putative membrane protein